VPSTNEHRIIYDFSDRALASARDLPARAALPGFDRHVARLLAVTTVVIVFLAPIGV
jgi:hypothetical protein